MSVNTKCNLRNGAQNTPVTDNSTTNTWTIYHHSLSKKSESKRLTEETHYPHHYWHIVFEEKKGKKKHHFLTEYTLTCIPRRGTPNAEIKPPQLFFSENPELSQVRLLLTLEQVKIQPCMFRILPGISPFYFLRLRYIELDPLFVCVCLRMCVFGCARARVCVFVCVRVCVRACVCV